MLSVFAAAWRVILKRTRADWLILAAAALIIILATSLLSTGPIYAGAVSLSGLHRTLNDAPTTDANVQMSARISGADFRNFDDQVTSVTGRTFAATGGPMTRLGVSDSYALPNQENVRDLAVFSFYENIDQHAILVDGHWGEPSDTVVEATIPDTTARLLNLSVGQTFDLTNRRDESVIAHVKITGIYRINATADRYWWDDTLETTGVEVGQSFTTYGPFVVSPATFFSYAVTPTTSQVIWRFYPIVENLQVNEIGRLRRGVESLQTNLDLAVQSKNRFQVATQLGPILRTAERSLLVTRTGVMILTVQLAVLAGYALVLTAGLLIGQRRVETALLRSRGASNGQVAAMALMEGLLLAVPAALAGPWIAAYSLRLLNVAGPLTAIELKLAPQVNQGAYLLSGISAVACVVALVLPAFLAARSFVDARSAEGRQGARGAAQRAGLDFALIVVAVLGYWQLRRYGAPITKTVQGRLGLDPFLVAAPALGLLAGAVAALRFIPLLARALDRGVVRRRGLMASLGAWQVARRPSRYARSALLLMLALAIGLFAVSYTQTWTRSQGDQAEYQVGSDLRITPDQRVGTALPAMVLPDAYQQITGVTSTMPVVRDTFSVSRAASGQLLELDAAAAGETVLFRTDLAEAALPDTMQQLVAARPSLPALTIPGEPQRMRVTASLALPAAGGDVHPAIGFIVRDGRGLLYRVDGGAIATDGQQHALTIPLAAGLGSDGVAKPQYPLTLIGIEMRMLVPRGESQTARVQINTIEQSSSLTGDDWEAVDLTLPQGWQWVTSPVTGVSSAPEISGDLQDATLQTGAVARNLLVPVTFTARPVGDVPAPPVAVIANDAFLTATETRVGQTVQMDIAGDRRTVLVVGSVRSFPTGDANRPVVVADLPTVQSLSYLTRGMIPNTSEWWMRVDEAHTAAIVQTLRAAPYSSWKIADRAERTETLQTDPVALGTIGALSLGYVAAALFATVGFIVSASVSARERLVEFALLRALGLSPWQLSGWLTLENGMLVAISLIGGTVLGLGLAWLILPFVTLTQGATAVMPGILVTIPWRTVIMLELLTIVVLAVVVAVLAVLLRRVGLGNVLRLGEE